MTRLGLEIDSAQARCGLGDSLHNALWFSWSLMRSGAEEHSLQPQRCHAPQRLHSLPARASKTFHHELKQQLFVLPRFESSGYIASKHESRSLNPKAKVLVHLTNHNCR
jgi:hypothetical protein